MDAVSESLEAKRLLSVALWQVNLAAWLGGKVIVGYCSFKL